MTFSKITFKPETTGLLPQKALLSSVVKNLVSILKWNLYFFVVVFVAYSKHLYKYIFFLISGLLSWPIQFSPDYFNALLRDYLGNSTVKAEVCAFFWLMCERTFSFSKAVDVFHYLYVRQINWEALLALRSCLNWWILTQTLEEKH